MRPLRAATLHRAHRAEFFASFGQGLAAAQARELEAAAALFGRAIALDPWHAAARGNYATVLMELEQWEASLASFDRAIDLKPDYAVAYCNRGNVLTELRRWDEALASYDRALELDAGLAQAYSNRGKVLIQLARRDDALQSCERAIAISPRLAQAYSNRGVAQRALGRLGEALDSYDRALSIDAGFAEALGNRGVVLQELAEIDAAVANYDAAIALRPDFAEAHFNRATALLARGEFARGWSGYESRLKMPEAALRQERRDHPAPRWSGTESLIGKTVLLHAEQGLGDTLQFCRYVPWVAALGATIILEVPAPLKTLLASLDGVAQIVVPGEALREIDTYTSLLSLPLARKTTVDTIPARIPYLASAADQRPFWERTLGTRTKKRVGLVWSGGFRPDQPELWALNARRNIPLRLLAPLQHPALDFYSLQKGEFAEAELAELVAAGWEGPKITDFTRHLRDFADTAALIEHLDLVIAVDTSTAHLAGALGKPVWLLNRFDSCWRWMLDRQDSPWYPTLKIYRQATPGAWAGVVEQVRQDLTMFAAGVVTGGGTRA